MNVITRALFASMLLTTAGAPAAAPHAHCEVAREAARASMMTVDFDEEALAFAIYRVAWRCDVAAAVAVAEQALSRPDTQDGFLGAWIEIGFARPEQIALELAGIDASPPSLRSATTAIDRASLAILDVVEKALPAVMTARQAREDPDDMPDVAERAKDIAEVQGMIAVSRLAAALRLGEGGIARGSARRLDALLNAEEQAERIAGEDADEDMPASATAVVDAFLADKAAEDGFDLDAEWTIETNRFRCGTMAMFAPKFARADKLRLDGHHDAALRSWLRATRGGLDDGIGDSEAIYVMLRERHGDRDMLRAAWAAAEASIWHDGRRAGWTLFGEALPLPTARRDFRKSESESEAEVMTHEALLDFVRASALYRLIHSP